MTEIPRGTQFVGQADARRVQPEVPKKAEFTPSPEQQQIADAMKESGDKLMNDVVEAKEAAGEKLQGLHGKELREAGKKQMVKGITETLKSELRWGIPLAILSGVGGASLGSVLALHEGGQVRQVALVAAGGAALGGIMGGVMGTGIGYEAAGLRYNKKVATTPEMSRVKFSDYVISHAGNAGLSVLLGILAFRFPRLTIPAVAAVGVSMEVFNPTTVRGLRDFIKGGSEMKKGM